MKELILLDSDSTGTVLCNRKYLSNIQALDNPLSINTNEELMKLHHKCYIPYIKNVSYNVQFFYQYHNDEIHDREILRHNGFGGITGIVSTHAKQDCKVQAIFKWFICNGTKRLK